MNISLVLVKIYRTKWHVLINYISELSDLSTFICTPPHLGMQQRVKRFKYAVLMHLCQGCSSDWVVLRLTLFNTRIAQAKIMVRMFLLQPSLRLFKLISRIRLATFTFTRALRLHESNCLIDKVTHGSLRKDAMFSVENNIFFIHR